MKQFQVKDSVYAYTTTSKQKKVQSIFITVNERDNNPQHFWLSFINALSVWEIPFSQLEKQTKFPVKADEKNLFINIFSKQLKSAPLVIIFYNFEQISNLLVREFVKDLLNIPHQYLYLLLLDYETKIFDDKKDSFSNIYHYFSKQEEWDFYRQYQINITEDELNQIRSYSDGWLAAVNIFAKYLQSDKKQFLGKLEDNIIHFSELYFLKECTKQQQETLIQFSLLEEFPLELVRHLAEENKQILPEQWLGSPFIRYNLKTKHFYFADFLQPHLQKRQVLLSNHQKEHFYIAVGDWYQKCGDKIMAINTYRKAHAHKKIIQVMQQWTFPNSAELANCYIETINEMPAILLDKHPILYIIQCHMLSTLYRYKDCCHLLKEFLKKYDQGEETSAKMSPLLGEAYLLLAHSNNAMCLNIKETCSHYKQAAAFLPNGSAMVRYKFNLFGDIPVIHLYSPESGSLKNYADYMRYCEPYLSQITGECWSSATYLAVAEIHFYTRNFKQVEPPIRKAIDSAIRHNQIDIICSAYYLLMRLNMAKGNYQRLIENFELLNQYAKWANYETFFSMPDLAKSWLMLMLGKKNEAASWIRHESQYQSKIKPWNYGRDRVLRCYYILLNQQFEEVVAYAEATSKLLYERGSHLLRIHMLIQKAIAYHKLKEQLLSIKTFEEVYQWTYQNHIVMPIIEYGKLIRPLIENCKKANDCLIPRDWLDEIEKKANSYYTYQHNIKKKVEQNYFKKTDISQQLTDIEQELLVLISQGLTLKMIAEMQGKSTSAVKGICRQVYAKLNVNNRADAVRIATLSGLVDE